MDESTHAGSWFVDVTDADFEAQVIERSKRVPVVVDFWAPWCGPCRVLGPLLEGLAEEHAGAFVLAKVNVDENPAVAGALRVQSIPMVLGWRDGVAVAQFVGALPEDAVRQFLVQLLPSEGDRLADAAVDLAAAGNLAEAEATLRRAVDADPRSDRALLGLAGLLAERGEYDEAVILLDRVPAGSPRRDEADRLATAIRVRQSGAGDETTLRATLAADPNDLDARFALAQVLAAGDRYADALEEYLAIVKRDRTFRDDAARKAMLDIFELLGPGHELADRYRSELAKVLFR